MPKLGLNWFDAVTTRDEKSAELPALNTASQGSHQPRHVRSLCKEDGPTRADCKADSEDTEMSCVGKRLQYSFN